MENVELEFTVEALEAIAQKSLSRGAGARGLRSVTEKILLDTMYEMPSMNQLQRVVIDETVVNEQAEPLLVFDQPTQSTDAK